jgi:hypothetical protein
MSDSIYARENVIQFPVRRAVKRDARRQTQYDALIDQLQAAHAREKVWLREKSDLLQVTSRFPRSSSIGLRIVCK